MRCQHCGQELEQGQVFCGFCGGSCAQTEPAPDVTPPAPTQEQQVSPAPTEEKKKSGAGRVILIILGILWLVGILGAWCVFGVVFAVTRLTKPKAVEETKPAIEEAAVYVTGDLTAVTWYQPTASGEMNVWTFKADGTAQFGAVGSSTRSTVAYTKNGTTVQIGDTDANATTWEYDSVERCYWHYELYDGTVYKLRVFAAENAPIYPAICYRYRTDESVLSVDAAVMNRSVAQELVNRYITYTDYHTCNSMEHVTDSEREAVLTANGYPLIAENDYYPIRLTCCSTEAAMKRHLAQYIDEALLNDDANYIPYVSYNGAMYALGRDRGYPMYFVESDPVRRSDGTYTVAVRMEFDSVAQYTAVFALRDGTYKITEWRE